MTPTVEYKFWQYGQYIDSTCYEHRAKMIAKENPKAIVRIHDYDTNELIEDLKVSDCFDLVEDNASRLHRCDICGKVFTGEYYPITDENFNKQHGLKSCAVCFENIK